MKTLIIGAGVTGLSAARRLLEHGLNPDAICIVDKSRGVGGRMASRRLQTAEGAARFDHGAQFFTARSDTFAQLLNAAGQAGAIRIWSRERTSSGHPYSRWCGCNGMTDLCKWMASDANLAIRLQTSVVNVGEYLKHQSFDAVIHTAPVPQALATLNGSGMLPPPVIARQLAAIQYHATVTVMLAPALPPVSCHPSGNAASGATQFVDHPDLAFITDNSAKGISTVPAITIHLATDRSEELWSTPDEDIISLTLEAASDYLGVAADPDALRASSVQRWRYAEPIGPAAVVESQHMTNGINQGAIKGCVMWGENPRIVLAGEAFDQPRVEGAFLSGRAAADALAAAAL